MPRPNYSRVLCCCSFLCSILLSNANKCPDPETFKPCKCDWSLRWHKVWLIPHSECKDIQQVQVLKKVFRDTTDHPLVYLTLSDSAFNFFPATALRQKSVRELYLKNVTMVGLFERTPEENNKLFHIQITGSNIFRGIQWEQLKNLHNLSNLVVHDVGIRSLRQDFTDNVPPEHLELLSLENNNMYRMHDTVFSRMSKLSVLSVIGGRITTLKRSMFPKENVIHTLMFQKQHISNLPSDIFNDMPRLKNVYLQENKFKTIPETTFKVLKDRNINLYLDDNEINCDCQIFWALDTDWTTRARCASPDYRNTKGKVIGGRQPDSLTRENILANTLSYKCL